MKRIIEKRSNEGYASPPECPTHLAPTFCRLPVYPLFFLHFQSPPVRFSSNQKQEKAHSKGVRKSLFHIQVCESVCELILESVKFGFFFFSLLWHNLFWEWFLHGQPWLTVPALHRKDSHTCAVLMSSLCTELPPPQLFVPMMTQNFCSKVWPNLLPWFWRFLRVLVYEWLTM
jgi:hypothetical protein